MPFPGFVNIHSKRPLRLSESANLYRSAAGTRRRQNRVASTGLLAVERTSRVRILNSSRSQEPRLPYQGSLKLRTPEIAQLRHVSDREFLAQRRYHITKLAEDELMRERSWQITNLSDNGVGWLRMHQMTCCVPRVPRVCDCHRVVCGAAVGSFSGSSPLQAA